MASGNRVWVIDTSSILEVRRKLPRPHQQTVYSKLDGCVNDGILVYPKHVLGELERAANDKATDLPYQWTKRNEARATRFGSLFDEVKKVLAQVPKIIDPDKLGVEEADPYVLALATYLASQGNIVTVVTEERKDRPDKMSMNTACGLLGLLCLPMSAFLAQQGIWPQS